MLGVSLSLALLFAATANARLQADKVAVIINDADPLSVKIGRYYAQARGISPFNIARITLPHDRVVLSSGDFKQLQRRIRDQIAPDTEAYVLTWRSPYRVDCMSITSAFTFGFARRYCASGCRPTAPNPYFNSPVPSAYRKFRMRLTMTIAAENFEQAKNLIDRGVAADNSQPRGDAYLVITGNKARDTRAGVFEATQDAFGYRLNTYIVNATGIQAKDNVMFYFTGTISVPYLDSLTFLPGAIGDHLTSHGGRLTGSNQMNAIEWLKAGATGSYGTVVEPCNFPQKFPNPKILLEHYLNGDTLVEAYWKSVVWPGQGIFIGEPLSAPYARDKIDG
ncbi:MAG: TIGR03790 family protein [Pseudomonadota bacterium]